MTGEPLDLDAKLERFDARAEEAAQLLVHWLLHNRPEMIAAARGRHVWGHYRYGNRNFAAWDADRLRAEILEEIADGIVYAARYLDLTSEGEPPPR